MDICSMIKYMCMRRENLLVPPVFKRAGVLRATPALLMTRNITECEWGGL